MNKIGGLWIKKSAKGNKFISGQITIQGFNQQVIIFENTRKEEGSKQPDYIVYESEPLKKQFVENQGKQKNQLPETGNIPKQEDIAF